MVFVMTLVLFVSFLWPSSAWAEVIQQSEGAGILVQSRHTLVDTAGHRWQSVLFQRWGSQEPQPLRLRLIGFPGTPELLHPQPLVLKTVRGEQWMAADVTEQMGDHPPAVGQYQVQEVIFDLSSSLPTQLSVSTTTSEPVSIRLLPGVIQEWQQVARTPNPLS